MSLPEDSPADCWTSVRFAGTFRAYQQRVLNKMDAGHHPRQFHIVAAPGSGKTILGLEMIRRLGAPALVVAPTIAIRDQWITRLCEHFTDHTSATPASLNTRTSSDLRRPAALTVVTYQSLFSAYTRSLDDDTGIDFSQLDVVQALRDAGVATICLDEAHHLRAQWHKAIVEVLAACGPVSTIALTATPPYDSTNSQWQKYIELCGPIDEEITAPELVASGDLCPHQDYIYVTSPTADETAAIRDLRSRGDEALNACVALGILTKARDELATALHDNAAFQEALDDEDAVSALLDIFAHAHLDIPTILQSFVGLERGHRPHVGGLQFILTHPALFSTTTVTALTELLTSRGLLHGTTIHDAEGAQARRMLENTASTVQAAAQIAASEVATLGLATRLVVLADHIRADYLDAIGTTRPLLHAGVIPTFEAIRRRLPDVPLAVLSGSVVLWPAALSAQLQQIADQFDEPLHIVGPVGESHVRVEFTSTTRGSVRCITHAFEQGLLTVLVGTAALLGEGWDAPSANGVILTSRIRAFMLTNQMRGRVIRATTDPSKTANVWHIAACDPHPWIQPADDTERVLDSFDFYRLTRRFTTFVAPHASEDRIESGIERCYEQPLDVAYRNIATANHHMMARANRRAELAERWRRALAAPGGVQLPDYQTRVRVDPTPITRASILDYWSVLFIALLVVGILASNALQAVGGSTGVWPLRLAGMGLIAAVGAAWQWSRLRRALNPTQRWRRQARAVLEAMRDGGLVTSDDLATHADARGITVSGGTVAERLSVATAIEQMMAPIRNPRYLVHLSRRRLLLRHTLTQAVPDVLGTNREHVDRFVASLHRQGLPMQATYVRTPQGRAALIAARRYAAQNLATHVVRAYRYIHPR